MSDEFIINSRGDQGVIRARVAGYEVGQAFTAGNPIHSDPAVLDVVLDTDVRIHFEVAATDEELKPLVERFRKLFEEGGPTKPPKPTITTRPPIRKSP